MGNQYYGASDFKAIHGFFANYTNFSGYSSRREYWWWQLSSTLVMTVVGFGLSLVMFGSWDNLMRGNSGEMNMLQVTAMVFGGVLAGVLLVAVCASARLYAIGGSLCSAGCYLYIFVRIVSDAEAFIRWLCG